MDDLSKKSYLPMDKSGNVKELSGCLDLKKYCYLINKGPLLILNYNVENRPGCYRNYRAY